MSANESTPASTSLAAALVCIAVSLALLYTLRGIVAPLCVALLLMALIEGLVRRLAHTWPSGPRWALVILAFVIIILVLGVCAMVLSFGVTRLIAEAPTLSERVGVILGDAARLFGVSAASLQEAFNVTSALAAVQPMLAGFGTFVAGVSLTIVFLAFMLASRALLAQKLAILAGTPAHAERFKAILDRITHSAGDYMRVQTVTGATLAVLCGIAFMVLGLDNPLFWAIIVFLCSYIPLVGGIIAGAAAALFALAQFPTYWPALEIFGSVLVIGALVGNVLLPKMQADKQNLDPTVAIFSVALWSLLWGAAGALLAIPLTVMLMIVFNQFDETRWVAVLISNDGTPES